MIARRETLVLLVAALFLACASAAYAQAPAVTKFVSPFKGEGAVEMTPGATKRDGNLVVTTFKVKNVSPGPLVGFKVEEYWYNKKGDTVSGSPSFRVMKPFMPGEVVEVTLRSPYSAEMDRRMTMFGHNNGKVKPKQVPKFSS
jgi:hypothetical protein